MPVGLIKKAWSDFQVFESGLDLFFETTLTGASTAFTRFALTKRGLENDVVILAVANQLQVPLSAITTYGRKDSFAETVQEIVVAGPFRPQFTHERAWLRQLGPADGPLSLGRHGGNTFSIKVYTEYAERLHGTSFKNYFGHQRFGGNSVDAGRYLIEGDFEKVFDLWSGTRMQPLRDRVANQLRQLRGQVTKQSVVLHPALRSECKTSIQVWQSHLWNCLAEETTTRDFRERLPMWDEANAARYERWWNPTDVVEEMLDLIYSFERPLWAVAGNFQSVRLNDGWRYRFTLRSGAYATVFLGSHFDLRDASVERYEARRDGTKVGT